MRAKDIWGGIDPECQSPLDPKQGGRRKGIRRLPPLLRNPLEPLILQDGSQSMTFTWILTPLPKEGSPKVTGSERGLTIASDSLADNADTLQGHPPRTRVSAAVPPPQGDCSPFHRPSPHSLAWAPANPFRDLRAHKQPRTTKNRLHEGRGLQAAG